MPYENLDIVDTLPPQTLSTVRLGGYECPCWSSLGRPGKRNAAGG